MLPRIMAARASWLLAPLLACSTPGARTGDGGNLETTEAGDSTDESCDDGEGCSCSGDQDCDPPLECVGGTCTLTCPPGNSGCPCEDGGVCDDGLVCNTYETTQGTCCESGQLGCSCDAEGDCVDLLECDELMQLCLLPNPQVWGDGWTEIGCDGGSCGGERGDAAWISGVLPLCQYLGAVETGDYVPLDPVWPPTTCANGTPLPGPGGPVEFTTCLRNMSTLDIFCAALIENIWVPIAPECTYADWTIDEPWGNWPFSCFDGVWKGWSTPPASPELTEWRCQIDIDGSNQDTCAAKLGSVWVRVSPCREFATLDPPWGSSADYCSVGGP